MPMVDSIVLANTILVITAGVLFYATLTDLKQYRISNELVGVLVALFFVHAVLSSRWETVVGNIAFAFSIFLLMLYFYSRDWVGGGDVKLLSAAFLWVGIQCALPFAILLLIFSGIHAAAAKFGWPVGQHGEAKDRRRIPFAPSVAASLVGTFLAGCLQPG
jgi:prepilin peptidase CpaA